MSRRRRAILLLALAGLLGGLAATDVAGRESALREALGPTVPIVVARSDLAPGDELRRSSLAVRQVPRRYAPSGAYASPRLLEGVRAAVAIPAGADLLPALVDDGTRNGVPVRAGERVDELVVRGAPDLVVAGARVDVLVTREHGDGAGDTTLALEDAEVLAARKATAAEAGDRDGPHVAVSLRVTLRQAVYLTAAQSFARDMRVLPRAAGDRRRGAEGTRVEADLR
jgi:pilus assembly protein CpaB